MRKTRIVVTCAALALLAVEAQAAQKFIPLGHSNLEQTANVPVFGSETSDFNLQADIYETQNYIRKKEARETDSFMRRWLNAPDSNPANKHIDY